MRLTNNAEVRQTPDFLLMLFAGREVTAEPTDDKATLTIDGAAAEPGKPSAGITLDPKTPKKIEIVVTAPADGSTGLVTDPTTYSLTATVQPGVPGNRSGTRHGSSYSQLVQADPSKFTVYGGG